MLNGSLRKKDGSLVSRQSRDIACRVGRDRGSRNGM